MVYPLLYFLSGFNLCEATNLIVVTPHTSRNPLPSYNHVLTVNHTNLTSSSYPTIYVASSTGLSLATATHGLERESREQLDTSNESAYLALPDNNSSSSSSDVSDYSALLLNPLVPSDGVGVSSHASSATVSQGSQTWNVDALGSESSEEPNCPDPLYCYECSDVTYFDPARTRYNGKSSAPIELGICHGLKNGSLQGQQCQCLKMDVPRPVCVLRRPCSVRRAITSGTRRL
ncbi:hypothetical protein OCU04_010851 [Sclerotinia nivalis]|uniref:Uncharacterized protein n=1 Tax=Sclerotinia nivalis TaxID=352851 RepID=A0A9X0ADU5_9HELO|nr:hypothetical protein OCU04_010851 [Sclerotinia nivalis]